MKNDQQIKERKERIRTRLLTGLILLLLSLGALAVFVYLNIQNQGNISPYFAIMFVAGMITLLISIFVLVSCRRVARAYCASCGAKIPFKTIKYEGKVRRFLILNFAKITCTTSCRSCSQKATFKIRRALLREDDTEGDVKTIHDMVEDYFNI